MLRIFCQPKIIGIYCTHKIKQRFIHGNCEISIIRVFLRRLILYSGQTASLQNLTDDDFDGAYQTISQSVDYFNLLNFPKPSVLKTKQNIQMMPMCMYYRKHSCLLKPFNDQINLYSSSGLIAFWASGFSKTRHNKNGQMEEKKLSINQISGLITVCSVLLVISIIVFIFELISTSHEAVRKLIDFFTFNTKSN